MPKELGTEYLNFKRKYAPVFPLVEIIHTSAGHIVTAAEPEALGDWFQASELDLYDASQSAFDPSSGPNEAMRCFEYIYYELASSRWTVFRPYSPTVCWSARQIFDTIKSEFAEVSWRHRVNLLNFPKSETTLLLQSRLAKMQGIKPNKGFPIMTVSKFLHFYNPSLFPIYDTEVIYNKVLNRSFKSDFRDFCDRARLPYRLFMNEDTVDFLPAYMRWANPNFSPDDR